LTFPEFRDLFTAAPDVTARAPGRVNLIGEHTDYNGGFVLPAVIPLETEVQLRRRPDRVVRVWSTAFPGTPIVQFDLGVSARAGDWADYVRAMFTVLRDRGVDTGADVRVDSRVPVGSGLSSSAALLVALARALREAFRLAIDDLEIALLARRAENEFVGAPVGIMDQAACSLAEAGSALLIDTATVRCERIPLPPDGALVVIDSGVRHSHATGDYRVRREECHRAAATLAVATLRDVTVEDLDRVARLPAPLNRRARHVVTENARVLAAAHALRQHDLARVGGLFYASHASMRDDFEVSVPEVDSLVEEAAHVPGVFGARLTGGGFGGSVVVLAERGRVSSVAEDVLGRHRARFPGQARVVIPAE
jgi:galactokinase